MISEVTPGMRHCRRGQKLVMGLLGTVLFCIAEAADAFHMDVGQQERNVREDLTPGPLAQGRASSNQVLAEAIAVKLRDGGFRDFDIQIVAEDGRIQLRGRVGDCASRERAAELAKSVDGVLETENALIVVHQNPGAKNGASQRIAERIGLAINEEFLSAGLGKNDINVQVDRSTATLGGCVADEASRQAAIKAAWGVPGVWALHDRLMIVSSTAAQRERGAAAFRRPATPVRQPIEAPRP